MNVTQDLLSKTFMTNFQQNNIDVYLEIPVDVAERRIGRRNDAEAFARTERHMADADDARVTTA